MLRLILHKTKVTTERPNQEEAAAEASLASKQNCRTYQAGGSGKQAIHPRALEDEIARQIFGFTKLVHYFLISVNNELSPMAPLRDTHDCAGFQLEAFW